MRQKGTAMTSRRMLIATVGSLLLPGTVAQAVDCPASTDRTTNSDLLDRYAAAYNAHDTRSFPEIFTETYLQRSGRGPAGLAAQIDSARRLFDALPDLSL